MARQTADQPITTREARKRLAPRAEPYWRALDAGTAIGYRRGATGGTWIGRALVEGKYRESGIGRADDAIRADGATYLDFRQASEKVKAWAGAAHRETAGLDAAPARRAPYTVGEAVADYLASYRRRGGKGLAQTQNAVNAHILPALGDARLDRLAPQRITRWRDSLADAAPRLRTSAKAKPGALAVRAIDPNDPEAARRRRATANRVLTVLKAALNHAHAAGRAPNADAWASVKPFKGADAPTVRHLTDAEATRLVNACPPDFRELVTAALLTGMRYGELAALRASAFNPDTGTVTVATSKSGKPRHVVLTDEGRDFFAQRAAGKDSRAHLFTRNHMAKQATRDTPAGRWRGPWGKSHQIRSMRDACAAAKIAPAVSFHILRHTYASRLAMLGAPMPVIAAQLGHEGTRMTERHYAHLAPSYVADTVRNLFGRMGIVPASNVQPFAPRATGA